MQISFLGATRTVTGSNFLVEAAGKKFIVDCGLYQGQAKETLLNTDDFLFEPGSIDFMLLTHAHIDHSGRIPKLYVDGFRGPIITTKATMELCSIMLPDSGHIQEMEVEWLNRKRLREGKHPVPPIYTQQDAINSVEIFKSIEYDEIISIDENIKIRFRDAGHMLGSAIIELWVKEEGTEKKVVFVGDIGNNNIALLKEPTIIEEADYLVMESTYGNRIHEKNEDKGEIFLNIVNQTLENGGNVIIPSFAVGRTQEILFELYKTQEKHHSEEFTQKYEKLMKTPIYVDSPLAISATEIFRNNVELFEEEIQEKIRNGSNPLEFPGLKFTRTPEESKALNESQEQAIIISASGMCEVGRIKHHLKHNLWRHESTILFVGYQAMSTLGRKIVDGAKIVKIFGEEVAVNSKIEYIEGFSGHADKNGLLNFIGAFKKKPSKIFLVHGEYEAQKALQESIFEQFGLESEIPEFGEVFILDERTRKVSELKSKNIHKYIRLEILEKITTIEEEIKDIGDILRDDLKSEIDDERIQELKRKLEELESKIVDIIEY